jgi:hypothetical protein
MSGTEPRTNRKSRVDWWQAQIQRQPRPHRDGTGHLFVQAMPAAREPHAGARHTKDGLLAAAFERLASRHR